MADEDEAAEAALRESAGEMLDEMTPEERLHALSAVVLRLMLRRAGYEMRDLTGGNMQDKDWAKIAKAYAELAEAEPWVQDVVKAKFREMAREGYASGGIATTLGHWEALHGAEMIVPEGTKVP